MQFAEPMRTAEILERVSILHFRGDTLTLTGSLDGGTVTVETVTPEPASITLMLLSCLSWKWRKRSSVKVALVRREK